MTNTTFNTSASRGKGECTLCPEKTLTPRDVVYATIAIVNVCVINGLVGLLREECTVSKLYAGSGSTLQDDHEWTWSPY